MESTEFYLTRMQRRAAVTEEQQVVHKLVEPPDTPPVQNPSLAGDAQDWHGLPEVAPAPSQHTGLHGLRHRQERQYMLQDLVRQSVDPLAATRLGRRLPPAGGRCLLLRHYAEQLGSAGSGRCRSCGVGVGVELRAALGSRRNQFLRPNFLPPRRTVSIRPSPAGQKTLDGGLDCVNP